MGDQETVDPCPICDLPTIHFRLAGNLVDIGCRRCGDFYITYEAFNRLPSRRHDWDVSKFKIVLPYTLRKMQDE